MRGVGEIGRMSRGRDRPLRRDQNHRPGSIYGTACKTVRPFWAIPPTVPNLRATTDSFKNFSGHAWPPR
jgi:hypothetical protein